MSNEIGMTTEEVLALGDELKARTSDPVEMLSWFSGLDDDRQQLLRDMLDFHFLEIPEVFQPLFADSAAVE